MPSTVKNQAIRDAKSVYKKSKKLGIVPILKKPVCLWNNQNYRIREDVLECPVLIDGQCKRMKVKVVFSDDQKTLIENADQLGLLRITQKSGKWMAQISIEESELIIVPTDIVMGVDLGLKVPAVAKTSTGKVKFFGNGRMNKCFKRRFRSLRKKLGQAKKLEIIKALHDKEERWMKDQDHKISIAIVDFAIENHVGTIKLEKLSGIRQTAKTSRKNEKNLHTWSFYRLAGYFEYKAALAGLKVQYVDLPTRVRFVPCAARKTKPKGDTTPAKVDPTIIEI